MKAISSGDPPLHSDIEKRLRQPIKPGHREEMGMKFGETAFHVPPRSASSWINNLLTLVLLAALAEGGSLFATAQEPSKQQEPSTRQAPTTASQPKARIWQLSPGPADIKSLPKNLFLDQKNFFTAPFRMNQRQWEWAFPALLTGAALIASDKTLETHVPTNPTTVSHGVTASNAGVAVLVASGAGLFLWGHLKKNDQQRETGLLAGEAAIGAFADGELFKYVAGRERPFVATSPGRFFVGGDSFPSAHASVSWAIASVIAHEYPGPLTQMLAYGV